MLRLGVGEGVDGLPGEKVRGVCEGVVAHRLGVIVYGWFRLAPYVRPPSVVATESI